MICISTALYIISTKLITHPKGFTSFQALMFYKKCCKVGLTSFDVCQKRRVLFKETALSFEAFKNLEMDDILEAYKIGDKFAHGKDYE